MIQAARQLGHGAFVTNALEGGFIDVHCREESVYEQGEGDVMCASPLACAAVRGLRDGKRDVAALFFHGKIMLRRQVIICKQRGQMSAIWGLG